VSELPPRRPLHAPSPKQTKNKIIDGLIAIEHSIGLLQRALVSDLLMPGQALSDASGIPVTHKT
jgi:hypothetical protein